MIFELEACGSRLYIDIKDSEVNKKDIEESFLIVEEFEKKFSRFDENSLLSRLNREKIIQRDEEFVTLINLAKKLNKLSNGYFDITINPILENLGYGIEKEKLEENVGMENIIITEEKILLKKETRLDFGAFGKGFIVDKVYIYLGNKYDSFIINFGGDIRCKGEHLFYLEDPFDSTKTFGKIKIKDEAIACSTPIKRQFNGNHHLINPEDKSSQNDKVCVFTKHKYATFADGFSTLLFVTPLEKSLKILNSQEKLEGLIIGKDDKIYKSQTYKILFG